jgi:hypothetical protein
LGFREDLSLEALLPSPEETGFTLLIFNSWGCPESSDTAEIDWIKLRRFAWSLAAEKATVMVSCALEDTGDLLSAFDPREREDVAAYVSSKFEYVGAHHMFDLQGRVQQTHHVFKTFKMETEGFQVPMTEPSQTHEAYTGCGLLTTVLPQWGRRNPSLASGYVQMLAETVPDATKEALVFIYDLEPYAAIAATVNGDAVVLVTSATNKRPFKTTCDVALVYNVMQYDLDQVDGLNNSPYGQASAMAALYELGTENAEKHQGAGSKLTQKFVDNLWANLYKGECPFVSLQPGATITEEDLKPWHAHKDAELFDIKDTLTKGAGLFAAREIGAKEIICSWPYHILAKGACSELKLKDEEGWGDVYEWTFGQGTDTMVMKHFDIVLEPNYPTRFINTLKVTTI